MRLLKRAKIEIQLSMAPTINPISNLVIDTLRRLEFSLGLSGIKLIGEYNFIPKKACFEY